MKIKNTVFRIILILVAVLALSLLCGCSASRQTAAESVSVDTTAVSRESSVSGSAAVIGTSLMSRFLEASDIRIDFYPPGLSGSTSFCSPPDGGLPRIRDEPEARDTAPVKAAPHIRSVSIGKISAKDSAATAVDLQLSTASENSVDSISGKKDTELTSRDTQLSSDWRSLLRLVLVLAILLAIYFGILWYNRRNPD